ASAPGGRSIGPKQPATPVPWLGTRKDPAGGGGRRWDGRSAVTLAGAMGTAAGCCLAAFARAAKGNRPQDGTFPDGGASGGHVHCGQGRLECGRVAVTRVHGPSERGVISLSTGQPPG